jgi:hypothetical protein
MSDTLGNMVGGAVSVGATGSSFGAWGTVVGALIGAVCSAYGTYKQDQANKAVNAQEQSNRNQDIAISDRRYNIELGLKKKEMATAAAESARQWKWNEENRSFQQANDIANRFMSLVSQEPAYQNQLISIFGKQQEPVQMPVLRERAA